MPVIMKGIVAGRITLWNIFVVDFVSSFALHINVSAICCDPIYVLIHTGKKTAKEIENIFATSPIPNQIITRGIIATGGSGRSTWTIGIINLEIILILPVSKPTTIPRLEPINSPKISLHKLSFISTIKVPDVIIPDNACKTFVGGGNRYGLTIELRDTSSQIIHTNNIGII
jgi:hypothetical protein